MRKVCLFMMISLDGYFEGPNHDLSWHNVIGEDGKQDAAFQKFAIRQLNESDILLFGRTTYEMMASFWLSKIGQEADPIVSSLMTNAPKIVFSRKLKKADWKNTRLISKNVLGEVLKLKKQAGKDLLILGSSKLCTSLMGMDLVDELRIMVNPVVLGRGTILFDGIRRKTNLKLFKEKRFSSGNILLYYKVLKAKSHRRE